QFLRTDSFVECGGEDLVVDLTRQVGEGIVLALGFARRVGIGVVIVRHLIRGGVGRFHFAGLLIFGSGFGFLGLRLISAGIVLAVLVAFRSFRLVLLIVFAIVLLVVAKLFGHVHGSEHVANGAC